MSREVCGYCGLEVPCGCKGSAGIVSQDSELDRLRAELERERMRLAACGVVALANTPETAAEARKMRDEYRSASCDDVAAAVDREMRLRKENAALREALELAVNHLDWIGWGDSWERECVRDSGDMEKINAALQGAKDD